MIKDTIFSPSFGNRPAQLVGREPVIKRFLDGLESGPGDKDRAIVLLGQRGSGKTVLLWELADRASEKGFVVATPSIATDDMLRRIVEKIQDAGEPYVKERNSHVSGGSFGVFGFSAGLQFDKNTQETKSYQYMLTQLCRKLTLQGRGVLILVDELQANSVEVRQLVATYQELVGERQNVALVMAGLPGAVSATLNDKVQTFLNRARKFVLDPLNFSDIDAFFARSFEKLGISISSELRNKASEATQGSPYLLQLIGHNLVLYAGENDAVDSEVLSNAIQSARYDFENDICKTTLSALSDMDVSFLRAMAEDEPIVWVKDIAERMNVNFDYAQKYRKRLIDAGIIEAPARGKVEFAVPYIADYLRNLD
ncbi:AAA family ATPase [Adlercreutzia sp. ZJ154]|uniref:AAA family ATPase n=1 Tax=Adlercreutzia sp. ZJ154 TaxID=2709790 RepID=UPI00198186E3|nr:ATP-binding protein [Adlercreutzia sp. ZJ154]